MDNEIELKENADGIPIKRLWYTDISFDDAKAFIKENIVSAARSFIAIGYYLKHIRDHELFREDGFSTIWDFAKAEYGLSMSTASRYMKMNDRFSQDGNSPYIQEAYKEFGKSQLQEMLSLSDDQLEQVTPDTQVLEIRSIRKGDSDEGEIPEIVQVPGQMGIEDFPEAWPESAAASIHEKSDDQIKLQYQVPTEELFAISQQEQETSCPPGIHDCRRQEWGTGQEEQAAGHKECEKCWSEWKLRTEVLGMRKPQEDIEPESNHEESVSINVKLPQDEGVWRPWEEDQQPDERYNIGDLPQASEKYLRQLAQILVEKMGRRLQEMSALGFLSDDSIKQKIIQLDEMEHGKIVLDENVEVGAGAQIIEFWSGDEDLGTCSYQRIATQVRRALDAKKNEKLEESESDQGEEPTESEKSELTDLQIAQEALERAKKLLNDCLKVMPDENDIHLRSMKIKVAALAAFVCDLDDIENPPLASKQPELPLLKNNDQRAAFVDNYETWPLWLETEQTGERYYRYDLADGTSMVVKVYHAILFDYKVTGLKYEERFTEGYGQHEYYLLKPGKFFKDCEVNRSMLIEKLKEIQKKER